MAGMRKSRLSISRGCFLYPVDDCARIVLPGGHDAPPLANHSETTANRVIPAAGFRCFR